MSQGQYRNNYMKKSRDAFALPPPRYLNANKFNMLNLEEGLAKAPH